MFRLVLTTFGNAADAERVVRILVEEKLAACGTLIPGARSIYAWKGRIEESEEVVVLFKTSVFESMEPRLRELHPYETPEIIALDPVSVSREYGDWVKASCRS